LICPFLKGNGRGQERIRKRRGRGNYGRDVIYERIKKKKNPTQI
jgi:fido (protein-threonine AMPylation protein)